MWCLVLLAIRLPALLKSQNDFSKKLTAFAVSFLFAYLFESIIVLSRSDANEMCVAGIPKIVTVMDAK